MALIYVHMARLKLTGKGSSMDDIAKDLGIPMNRVRNIVLKVNPGAFKLTGSVVRRPKSIKTKHKVLHTKTK